MAEKDNFKHLVRVANTDLDGNKSIKVALTKIKGVGDMYANMACRLANVAPTEKTGYLPDDAVQKIEDVIVNPAKYKTPSWMLNRRKDLYDGEDKHLLTADLMFQKENDIKSLKKKKCYRGFRHMDNLPARGQKTKSNFRRNKGKVFDLVINLEKGRVETITTEPLKEKSKAEAKKIISEKSIPYKNVTAVDDIFLITEGKVESHKEEAKAVAPIRRRY